MKAVIRRNAPFWFLQIPTENGDQYVDFHLGSFTDALGILDWWIAGRRRGIPAAELFRRCMVKHLAFLEAQCR